MTHEIETAVTQTVELKTPLQRFRQGVSRVGISLSLSLGGGIGTAITQEIIAPQEAVAATPEGSNDFDQSKIVPTANAELGSQRATGWNQPGECMVAMGRWVNAAAGKTVWNPNATVYDSYIRSGAVEVGLNELKSGDVLQRVSMGSDFNTNWDHVHTMVFEGYAPDGTVNTIDSNSKLDGVVREHVYGNTTFPSVGLGDMKYSDGSTWKWRAFRFGKVNSTGTTPAGKVSYASVAEGQELYSDQGWVYTKAGGTAFLIKNKNQWTSSDSTYWGNNPIGPVPVAEVHDHEAGVDQNGNRVMGAHPPRDGTDVYIGGGNGQQYYANRGRLYPIGVGEIDDLGVRNKAIRIPATGDRWKDFIGGGPKGLPNGELYLFAGTSRVNQMIEQPDKSTKVFHVNNETVLNCLKMTQNRNVLILPQSAKSDVEGWSTVSSQVTGCKFPSGWVLNGPGGVERWRIEGDNNTQGYSRRYYPDTFTAYLNTSGNPEYHTLLSTPALNNVPQGQNMDIPKGVYFVNDGNGDTFKNENGVYRKVPWSDMLSCLGNPSLIHVPGNVIGALPQGPQMTCDYENRIVARPDGRAYHLEGGRSHSIGNAAIRDCIAVRKGTGQWVSASNAQIDSYTPSTNAYCNYESEPGLNFVQEQGDPTVWVVRADGTKQHAGSLCVPDPYTTSLKNYRVHQVPVGETAGHTQGPDFWATGAICDALPKP